jgi:hypothetical protein
MMDIRDSDDEAQLYAAIHGTTPSGQAPEPLGMHLQSIRDELCQPPSPQARWNDLAAMRRVSKGSRPRRGVRNIATIAAATATVVVITTGLAAAGRLPGPAQHQVANLADAIGLDLPGKAHSRLPSSSPPPAANTKDNAGVPVGPARVDPATPDATASNPGAAGTPPGGSGSAPGHSGSTSGASGDAPGQTGNTPGQSGSAPGQIGSTPSGTTPGTAPGRSGTAPGQTGSTPGKSGTTPGQSSTAPGSSGTAPGRSKPLPSMERRAPAALLTATRGTDWPAGSSDALPPLRSSPRWECSQGVRGSSGDCTLAPNGPRWLTLGPRRVRGRCRHRRARSSCW